MCIRAHRKVQFPPDAAIFQAVSLYLSLTFTEAFLIRWIRYPGGQFCRVWFFLKGMLTHLTGLLTQE